MRRLMITVLGGLLLATPVAAGVHVERDEFKNTTTYYTDTILEFHEGHVLPKFNFIAVDNGAPGWQNHPAIGGNIVREDWMFIKPGESLIFKIGEKRYPLKTSIGSADCRKVLSGGLVTLVSECVVWEIDLLFGNWYPDAGDSIRIPGAGGVQSGCRTAYLQRCKRTME